jgi:high-affinity Fe2+/Pb2+ permease
VRAALITGMFGLQPSPTWAEVIAWLAYAVPFLFIVAAPSRAARQGKFVQRAPATVGR